MFSNQSLKFPIHVTREEKNKPKTIRRKIVMKIRVHFNKIENIKTIEKSETQSWFFKIRYTHRHTHKQD